MPDLDAVHPFSNTHWSVVLDAARSNSPAAEQAIRQLCEAYWFPLYAWLRRHGHAPEDAEDLVQDFFAEKILTRSVLQNIGPEKGRFRTWLLTCLKNLAHTRREEGQALKRGGGHEHVSLEMQDAEGRYLAEPADWMTPDRLFEKAWAATLLERAIQGLRERYVRKGRQELFDHIRHALPGTGRLLPYAEIASRLGLTEDAVKMEVSRLRKEIGPALLVELRPTVAGETDAREELKHLLEALVG
jgi:RNA polymerase sigma-70 factor (ECF subfamily)